MSLDPGMIDHEYLILDRFRCPQCGKPLELIERRDTPESRLARGLHYGDIKLMACCSRCEIGMSQEQWERRRAG